MKTKTHVIQRTSGALLALTFLLAANGPLGCASETKTTTTTTTTREPGDPNYPVSSGPEVSRHTTTTVQKSDDGCSGVLSCTVDFAGDVIAFPFRVVGAVFRALF